MAALGTDQVILEESGKPFVEVDCQHTKALRAYILGLGAQVEVLGPEELRQWIGAQVASIAGNYPDQNSQKLTQVTLSIRANVTYFQIANSRAREPGDWGRSMVSASPDDCSQTVSGSMA